MVMIDLNTRGFTYQSSSGLDINSVASTANIVKLFYR
jgi:hypothetical protein